MIKCIPLLIIEEKTKKKEIIFNVLEKLYYSNIKSLNQCTNLVINHDKNLNDDQYLTNFYEDLYEKLKYDFDIIELIFQKIISTNQLK